MRRMEIIGKDGEAALFKAGTQSYFFHYSWKVFKKVRVHPETTLDIVMERYRRKPPNIELLSSDSDGNYLFWDRATCYFVSFALGVFARVCDIEVEGKPVLTIIKAKSMETDRILDGLKGHYADMLQRRKSRRSQKPIIIKEQK